MTMVLCTILHLMSLTKYSPMTVVCIFCCFVFNFEKFPKDRAQSFAPVGIKAMQCIEKEHSFSYSGDHFPDHIKFSDFFSWDSNTNSPRLRQLLFYMALPRKTFSKLQKIQNLPARVKTSFFHLSSHTLLNWLPVEYHINFKIDNITFHTLHSSQPACLHSALHVHHSTHSLRLSNTNLFSVPFVRTSFGARSFSVAAPKIQNSLPPALRMDTSLNTLCRHLKTHYLQQAFQSA